jgi:hypothetical protein
VANIYNESPSTILVSNIFVKIFVESEDIFLFGIPGSKPFSKHFKCCSANSFDFLSLSIASNVSSISAVIKDFKKETSA